LKGFLVVVRKRLACVGLVCGLFGADANARAQTGIVVEHGTYSIHLLLHAIGTEEYSVTEGGAGGLTLHTSSTTNDRGMKRSSSSVLAMDAQFSPLMLEQSSVPANPDGGSQMEVNGARVSVREGAQQRTMERPAVAFAGFGSMPASVQMMMMRYWKVHHQPARLTILRASDRALPVEIKLVGHDAFLSKGRMVRLARYTVANLVFGREILWMDDSNRLAAVMTFAGGLPQEIVLDEYVRLMGELFHNGVRQEMLDLADLDHAVPAEAQGSFAIVGARLIDGTGADAVEHSVVVIRDGRIAAVGAQGSEKIPSGMRVVHADGESLLPGLWEMHSHYSGVEFGPALLAAGVTTARDCGGEMEFLTQVRRAIDQEHALGPRLLLAGLIDSGGPLAFGAVDVETPEQGVAAVDAYADARFDQTKVYTQIQPAVLRAISAEAHARGMTVTGHVPAAINAFEGVEDGMDQINHLQFVTRSMKADDAAPLDLSSQRAQSLIALLKSKQIVVDPTVGWGEMAGHPKSFEVAMFEPGIKAAPFTLASKFAAMGVPAADEAKFRARMQTNLEVIQALFRAGVPIVAGSDTGLIGFGLDRELELYVGAGMTPMQAIQSATIVAARAMKHDADSGTVEVGKRADLMLVDGDPLKDISDLRRVVSVVTDGRMYDSKKLGRSVGFNR
jgi:imidazolonepropionase-like amidohydrolase